MKYFPVICGLALSAFSALAAGPGETVLDYKVGVRLREGGPIREFRMELATTPPVATASRRKHKRLVGWRLRARPGRDGLPPASVLTRVAGLFYLAEPAPSLVPREGGVRFGNRFCRFWQAQTPASVGAFVYLVEVAPDLLALDYLSASLAEGEIATLEIHLEKVAMAREPAPAEDGERLLHTLRKWGALLEAGNQMMEPEQIQ